MTLKEKVLKFLTDGGMFDEQAAQVFEAIKNSDENEAMRERWNEPAEDYPSVLVSALNVSAAVHAVEWLDENLPLAWFRPVFAGFAGMD